MGVGVGAIERSQLAGAGVVEYVPPVRLALPDAHGVGVPLRLLWHQRGVQAADHDRHALSSVAIC